MRSFFRLLFIATLLFSCSNEPDTIKIGSVLPLTGDAASWGKPVQNAVQMAVDEINESGGIKGKTISIIFEDSKAEPATGVSVMQKLVNQDKPIAVIGAVASSVSIAIVPIAEKNKVPLISPASTSPKLTGISKYFFRVIPTDKLRAEKFAEHIYGKGISELDIVFINNEGGAGAKEAFVKKYNELGGKVTLVEGYAQGTNDFRSVLNKSKKSSANALMIISYPEDTSTLLRQIRELGINKEIFALTEALDDPQVVANAQGAADGVEYIVPAVPEGPKVDEFRRKYEERYGNPPQTFTAEGYDIVYIIKSILEISSEMSSEAILSGLDYLSNFDGVSGDVSFDENGDVKKEMIVKKINNK